MRSVRSSRPTCRSSSGTSAPAPAQVTPTHILTSCALRISATDWLEESLPDEPSWTPGDTVQLAGLLASHGVDLLDVSSGGAHPAQQIHSGGPAYQAPFAARVKQAHGARLLVLRSAGNRQQDEEPDQGAHGGRQEPRRATTATTITTVTAPRPRPRPLERLALPPLMRTVPIRALAPRRAVRRGAAGRAGADALLRRLLLLGLARARLRR